MTTPQFFIQAKHFVCHSEPIEKSPERNVKTSQTECEVPSPDKTLAFCLKGTSTFFDRKMRSRRRPLLFCVLCARLLKGIKNITRRWRSKTYPLPQGGSPIAVPPQAGPTATLTRGHLSVSQSGAFSDCVTRFRGGALRHAKFPKTSYKVQLLDTRLHAACVSLNHRRRRDLISRSS